MFVGIWMRCFRLRRSTDGSAELVIAHVRNAKACCICRDRRQTAPHANVDDDGYGRKVFGVLRHER